LRAEHFADLIVVGSGVAGLSAALAAAKAGATVRLLTAGALLAGSSPRAQGGVAAAVGADDAPALHAVDTLAVGAGLNDPGAVQVLVREGSQAARRLLADGVPFDGGPDRPDLGLEAGHGRRRILHAGGAATGQTLTAALLVRVVEHLNVSVHANTPAEALILEGQRVVGVRNHGAAFHGRAVVLATGGYASLWGRTTNGPESRGTGLALAWQTDASLADLEFVQFHPTALELPGRPAYLLSEALRGEGACVVEASEQPIVDPLLPRDVVARVIARHRRHHGSVFLSMRHLDPLFVRQRFPNLAAQLAELGLDLARDLLPVAPAAHYCMGGVRADTWGRTDVPGLYAAGEVACTGVQGANRLASNSLLECLVFGARAARAALTDPERLCASWVTQPLPECSEWPTSHHSFRLDPPTLGERLDRDLGVERAGASLSSLVADLPDPDAGAPFDGAWLAALVAHAALLRRESRGAHYRADAPEAQPRWRGRIHWRRDRAPHFEEVSS
jgi:L-aspartate oxidase